MLKDPWWILIFIVGMLFGSLAKSYFNKKDYKDATIEGAIAGAIFYGLIQLFT